MEPDLTVLASLRKAVEALPDDVPLRVHLARLLLQAGQRDEAIRHVGAVLQRDPGNAEALVMLQPPGPPAPPAETPGSAPDLAGSPAQTDTGGSPAQTAGPGRPGREGTPAAFDWSQAESELRDVLPPMFVGSEETSADSASAPAEAYDAERSTLKLADVAGMNQVKQRLEAAFLAPMRNPDLRRLYGKSLRGGLLLYGPPGCGKTFIARAVAGELGARFMSVSFADIIDMFVGQSERNIH
ncbi:MAG TPA: tetratricopeptide repeat protein, partial [Streptosporangiaceae bacterium]